MTAGGGGGWAARACCGAEPWALDWGVLALLAGCAGAFAAVCDCWSPELCWLACWLLAEWQAVRASADAKNRDRLMREAFMTLAPWEMGDGAERKMRREPQSFPSHATPTLDSC